MNGLKERSACRHPLRRSLVAGVLVWIGALSAQADLGTDAELTRLMADDLAVVARGEIVYGERCGACHGDQLEGQPDWRTRVDGLLPAPPHDATGHTWHHDDDLLFEIVKYGPGVVIGDPAYRTAMPAFAAMLPDEDIVAVLSFIKHRWPERERGWQDEVNAEQLSRIDSESRGDAVDRLFK